MDDNSEILLKKICCTCLSEDRKLFQLCRVKNGINNLYWLLSSDSEAFREGFHRHGASLYICWECNTIMTRICNFRQQACDAQRHLTCLVEGQYIIKKPGSKPRRNKTMMDTPTDFGFLCIECNKYFETKKSRWIHVQRTHREGFECTICGKRFPFKNNLTRHQITHTTPQPRVECTICHKLVRTDLSRAHARTHAPRDTYACALCVKTFASQASYEHHLKYTKTHAVIDINKYKCSVCDKGYKSKGELRDHINYRHMGKTQHKCPQCGKALATRRCVTRHVRRAHDGLKENARDKMCQQCGKAFRDKKGLREHELIHTGERPLSCEICGCTFRQNASLYTHRKRVHKIYNKRRIIEIMESEIPNT
ncbi:PREDICTED: zinc finger protein 182-like isoform X1 [Papilio xuthus]|uniref:Zinc finger protein 182-like isoform X1 n=1 Tax=Papilio xuthus TaxID=66420 RepID=A0AAJ6Z0P2_PAPXU|nr:PREDICTED: zinc finger protein 182-like isoform X1 [Papilio xuthus]